MNIPSVKPWINVRGKLSENPLWDHETQTFYWTDIDNRRIYACDWADKTPRCIHEGDQQVGGFTIQEDGSLLLFRERDIALLHKDGQLEPLHLFSHEGSRRFNDVIADPMGRVFAGTIGHTPESGGLFRIERDGNITQVAGGTGCSNGMVFSPDQKFLYWTCSTRRKIFRFPYNASTGSLGEPTVIFQAEEADGIPDGLASDCEGNLYSIRWGAHDYGMCVMDPEGKILHKHKTPAKASTSLCFCGKDLTDAALTAADLDDDPSRESDVFLLEGMPIAGRVEFRSRIE